MVKPTSNSPVFFQTKLIRRKTGPAIEKFQIILRSHLKPTDGLATKVLLNGAKAERDSLALTYIDTGCYAVIGSTSDWERILV